MWNEYVHEIGASDEALIIPAELHYLRDAHFAVAQLSWPRGQNIWTVSTIYVVGTDGKLAEGCRPIETLRILYDLDMLFDNLRSARERVRKGVLLSDDSNAVWKMRLQIRKLPIAWKVAPAAIPSGPAERRYVQEHSPYVLNGVMEKLFDELFPPAD